MIHPTKFTFTNEKESFHYIIENITNDMTKYNY